MSSSHTSPLNDLSGPTAKHFPHDVPSSDQSSGVPTPEFATNQTHHARSPRFGQYQPQASPMMGMVSSSRAWSAQVGQNTPVGMQANSVYDFTSMLVSHGNAATSAGKHPKEKPLLPLSTPLPMYNPVNTPPVVPLLTPPLTFPKRDQIQNPMQPIYHHLSSTSAPLSAAAVSLALNRTHKAQQQMQAAQLQPQNNSHLFLRQVELNGVFCSTYHGLMQLRGDNTPQSCPFFLLEQYNVDGPVASEDEVSVHISLLPRTVSPHHQLDAQKVLPLAPPQTPTHSAELGLSQLNNLETACAPHCLSSVPNIEQLAQETGRRKRQRVTQWPCKPKYTVNPNLIPDTVQQYQCNLQLHGAPAATRRATGTWLQSIIASCTSKQSMALGGTSNTSATALAADYLSPVFNIENAFFGIPNKHNSDDHRLGLQSPVSSLTLPLTPKNLFGVLGTTEQKSDYPVQPTKVRSLFSSNK